MKLVVATCQFPVGADARRNLGYVRRQMRTARERGAHVAHFCEGSLSGYAGAHGRDPIAFSILMNGLERKQRRQARALQDALAERIASERSE